MYHWQLHGAGTIPGAPAAAPGLGPVRLVGIRAPGHFLRSLQRRRGPSVQCPVTRCRLRPIPQLTQSLPSLTVHGHIKTVHGKRHAPRPPSRGGTVVLSARPPTRPPTTHPGPAQCAAHRTTVAPRKALCPKPPSVAMAAPVDSAVHCGAAVGPQFVDLQSNLMFAVVSYLPLIAALHLSEVCRTARGNDQPPLPPLPAVLFLTGTESAALDSPYTGCTCARKAQSCHGECSHVLF